MSRFFLILAIVGVNLFSLPAFPANHIRISTDGKVYKIVCDPTKQAAFCEGLTGKVRCKFIESDFIEYMINHDEPCDQSFSGQFLRGFLGQACESTKNLQVRPERYARFVTCNDSKTAQFLEGLLGKSRCHETFKLMKP